MQVQLSCCCSQPTVSSSFFSSSFFSSAACSPLVWPSLLSVVLGTDCSGVCRIILPVRYIRTLEGLPSSPAHTVKPSDPTSARALRPRANLGRIITTSVLLFRHGSLRQGRVMQGPLLRPGGSWL